MQRPADFERLKRALDDAVDALPQSECARHPADLRRQCRELLLLLLQTRERVRRLSDTWPR